MRCGGEDNVGTVSPDLVLSTNHFMLLYSTNYSFMIVSKASGPVLITKKTCRGLQKRGYLTHQ